MFLPRFRKELENVTRHKVYNLSRTMGDEDVELTRENTHGSQSLLIYNRERPTLVRWISPEI